MTKTKLLTILFLSLVLVIPVSSPVNGYTVIERDDLNLDENLSDTEQRQYAFPEKILITRIESPADQLGTNSENWIDVLHYYFITRLGFADLPFNYLVDRQGNVYEGRSNSEGVIPELDPVEGAILIGYLSNNSDVTLPASESMGDLVEDISYRYGIERDMTEVVDLRIASNADENALAKLTYEVTQPSVFLSQAQIALGKVNYSSEEHLEFIGEVVSAEHEKSIVLGGVIPVKVVLKNSGTQPWFTFNDFIYVVTADGDDSEFAVNVEWDAFDTPTHIEGETVLPGDTVEVEFNLNAFSLPGAYSETFVFSRLNNKRLTGTEFSINFDITAGDKQLIEIQPTETGTLNVRTLPQFNGDVIAQVDTGERFIVIDYQEGWYKIAYNGQDEGWIYGQYVKQL